MNNTDAKMPMIEESQETQHEIFANVPFTYNYDQVIVLNETNASEWNLKSRYLQKNLWQMGMLAEPNTMPVEETVLVGYTYPKVSELETCLFFTNKKIEKNQMVGLPGCARDSVYDRPYFGILVHKDNRIEFCASYGNNLCKPMVIPIQDINQETSRFISTLLEYWAPVKSL